MSGEVRLGLRLATGHARGERLRAAGTVGAHLVGVWVMLLVLAAVRAEVELPSYDGDGLPFLTVTVVATVGVPIAVLMATMARLSASIRDRRLASLRVLGLSASRTRLVSAVEAGAGALVGSVSGLVLFWVTRPTIGGLDVAGRDWSTSSFQPWTIGMVLTVVGLPLVAVCVAMVPGSGRPSVVSGRPPMSVQVASPSPWRLVPLPLGLAVVVAAVGGVDADSGLTYQRFSVLVAGGVLSAVGLVLVLPVFTRLIAEQMLRIAGRPSLRIAGRRLQSQPAGVSRIVAGLLIALFVVAGSRVVLAAFETSEQYRAADRIAHGGTARYDVIGAEKADPVRLAASLDREDGVLAAYPAWQVVSGCTGDEACVTAFVGTCDDLLAVVPDAKGCRADRPAWLDEARRYDAPDPSMTWSDQSDPPGASVTAPTPTDVISSAAGEYAVTDAMQADVFLPVSTPGIDAVVAATAADTLVPVSVLVDTGTTDREELGVVVAGVDPLAEVLDPWEDESYDFVTGLRSLVWAVAAVVLAIGLVGFAVATMDRAVSRRAEMVNLQLVGAGRGVLRAAQWWEAAVPLVFGVVLAIASGTAVGYSYLVLTEDAALPWRSIGTLTVVSVVAAVGVAGMTVVACAPRIRAELIRRA
jgi:putative ABC transport system permease protein